MKILYESINLLGNYNLSIKLFAGLKYLYEYIFGRLLAVTGHSTESPRKLSFFVVKLREVLRFTTSVKNT